MYENLSLFHGGGSKFVTMSYLVMVLEGRRRGFKPFFLLPSVSVWV